MAQAGDGGSSGGAGGSSGGGGGGGGDGNDGEEPKDKNGPLFRWKGWEDRMAADPQFGYKVFIEQVGTDAEWHGVSGSLHDSNQWFTESKLGTK